jgi:predicted ferric reductase
MIQQQSQRTVDRVSTAPDPLVRSSHIDQPEQGFEDALLEVAPYTLFLLISLLLLAGTAFVALTRPEWLTALWASMSGTQPKFFWYVSRSSAMVAYVLLWISMASGLAISNKLLRVWPGGPTVAALHEYTSILGLVFAAFHGFILLWDGYSNYTLSQLLIPFASESYRPFWVGLGQLAFYIMLPVTLSFYIRRWIGYRAWRILHYLSFALFLLALAHGLMSGSESSLVWVRNMYWASGVSLVGLTIYRITLALAPPAQRVRA